MKKTKKFQGHKTSDRFSNRREKKAAARIRAEKRARKEAKYARLSLLECIFEIV